jgi:hypothetical protein
MRIALRFIALAIMLVAVIGWFTAGGNRGWTRTSEVVRTVDSVTGIEGIEYRKRFAPGIDALGGALLGSLILAGGSFLFRNTRSKQVL